MTDDLREPHDGHNANVASFGLCPRCERDTLDRPGVKLAAGATDTSRAAGAIAYPRSGTARHRVLGALAERPMTDEQLQAHLSMPANTERPRRIECVDNGWVIDSGARDSTATGADAIVWTITPAGLAALAGE